jgi:hypothetical protein
MKKARRWRQQASLSSIIRETHQTQRNCVERSENAISGIKKFGVRRNMLSSASGVMHAAYIEAAKYRQQKSAMRHPHQRGIAGNLGIKWQQKPISPAHEAEAAIN